MLRLPLTKVGAEFEFDAGSFEGNSEMLLLLLRCEICLEFRTCGGQTKSRKDEVNIPDSFKSSNPDITAVF